MQNIFLTLFDPQLDHANSKGSTQADWRPSVAPAYHDRFISISEYYLLAETEHLQAAQSLVKTIQKAFTKTTIHMRDIATTKKRRDFASRLLNAPPTVKVIEINYKNVWDLNSCLEDLTVALSELTLAKQNTQIYINTATGTAQQRTALIFWLLKMLRPTKTRSPSGRTKTTPNKHSPGHHPLQGFLLAPSVDKQHPSPAGQITCKSIGDTHNTIGFLRMAVNTQHDSLRDTIDRIEKLIVRAPKDPILLTGPTGAGKSHLAHLIIEYLKCLDPTYTDENCRAQNIAEISKDLIASELFGHEAGAFTGASKRHIGLFEKTKDGILFLDEIGELSLDLQAQLLTVLDNGNIRRVGGESIVANCRPKLIFGTNRNLMDEVRAGRFRHDLYERIAMWHFDIPGIRERPADFPRFIQYELAIWRQEIGINCRFEKDAEARFLSFAKTAPWAGNFREFHTMIRRLAMFAENGTTITLNAVDREINEHATHRIEVPVQATPQSNSSAFTYDLIDLAQIAIAIDICKQSKTAKEAGEKLFAATRSRNPATFNGATNLQRLFAKAGLKVKFKTGAPEFSPA